MFKKLFICLGLLSVAASASDYTNQTPYGTEISPNINEIRNSALITAVRVGCVAVVEFFLKDGADIHVRDNQNLDILSIAIQSKKVEVLKCLFDHIPDKAERRNFLTATDFLGNTVLMQSIIHREYQNETTDDKNDIPDVFMWLVEEMRKADVDLEECMTATNNLEDNIINCAATMNCPNILKCIFELLPEDKCLAMLNQKDRLGRVPVMWTLIHGGKIHEILSNYQFKNIRNNL